MAINKRDRNRDKQFKIASIFILANLILCTLLTGLYKYNTDQLVLHYENEMFVRRDAEWNTVELYINELYNSLESKLSSVAQKVESNIIFSYKDNMSELQKQLEDGNYIHLCNTIREDIKDVYLTDVKNDNNDIFVAVHDGIILDYSLSKIPYADETVSKSFRTWEEYISTSVNPELTEKAIELILDQHNSIIFEQAEGEISFIEHQLDEIKKLYMQDGITALRNYTFLVPVYITEDGDIFGNVDIMYGHKYKTYKIILIQEFNVYDQLEENYPGLMDDSKYRCIDSHYDDILLKQNLIGIIILLELITCISLSCVVFNLVLRENKKE